MWETEQFRGTIDFHSIFFFIFFLSVEVNSVTNFLLSSCVFSRTKKCIQFWNNFHLWVWTFGSLFLLLILG